MNMDDTIPRSRVTLKRELGFGVIILKTIMVDTFLKFSKNVRFMWVMHYFPCVVTQNQNVVLPDSVA